MSPRSLNPLARAQVEILPRPKVPAAQRARVLAKHDGQCSRLDCTETAGLEIDHVIARGLGGSDAETNLAPLCKQHHAIKTRNDKALIAKAKRLIAREDGTRRPRQKIQGGGFRTDITRGFDGKVRRRNQAEDQAQ